MPNHVRCTPAAIRKQSAQWPPGGQLGCGTRMCCAEPRLEIRWHRPRYFSWKPTWFDQRCKDSYYIVGNCRSPVRTTFLLFQPPRDAMLRRLYTAGCGKHMEIAILYGMLLSILANQCYNVGVGTGMDRCLVSLLSEVPARRGRSPGQTTRTAGRTTCQGLAPLCGLSDLEACWHLIATPGLVQRKQPGRVEDEDTHLQSETRWGTLLVSLPCSCRLPD